MTLGQPLQGFTVLSIEQAVAAPFATRQLADLGARVIKIERVEGDFARAYDGTVHGGSSFFAWLNRGKESVVVDIKSQDGLALLRRIVAASDVVVQNLVPGAFERLGLDPSALLNDHPRLVVASISGYGRGGPYEHKKAYDLLVQCEAGLLSVTGSAEAPAKVGISVADIAAGMYAFSGVLAALLERERHGRGQVLEVSMLEALGEWMSQPQLFAAYGGRLPARAGARHASIAPYGPVECADGTIFVGVQNDREWILLCTQVLRRPELAQDPRFASNIGRVQHVEAVADLLADAFRGRGVAETEAELDRVGIANARLRSVADLSEHPQLVARQRWHEVQVPGGVISAPCPPVTVLGAQARMAAVPALGEHTDAIRAEFSDVLP